MSQGNTKEEPPRRISLIQDIQNVVLEELHKAYNKSLRFKKGVEDEVVDIEIKRKASRKSEFNGGYHHYRLASFLFLENGVETWVGDLFMECIDDKIFEYNEPSLIANLHDYIDELIVCCYNKYPKDD